MAQLTNIRTVSVAGFGKLALAEKPGTFTPSGTKRDPKPGRVPEDGGFISTSTQAKLELSLNMQAGMDIQALGAIEGQDVTVRLSDGTVHLMSQAWAEGPVAVSDGEGKLTLHANTSEVM